MFNLVCRIGELKALRWSDFDFEKRLVYIHTQIIETKSKPPVTNETICMKQNSKRYYTHVNYVKKHIGTGTRYQYLTEDALETLKKIKEQSTNEYLFLKNDMFLITTTFNEYLQKYCRQCNIEYRSSHKIRFYNATLIYDGTNLTECQKILGHTNSAMTLKYFRDINEIDNLKNTFSKLEKLETKSLSYKNTDETA